MIKEACVETRAEIDAALRGGADRIELCSRLDAGGFTPAPELLEYAVSRGLSVAAMVRRAAGFSMQNENPAELKADVHAMTGGGAAALVFGYLALEDGIQTLDIPALSLLIAEAKSAAAKAARQTPELVFHMAFDELPYEARFDAIGTLVRMGFTRVLTKGGTGKAEDNIAHLKKLNEYAQGKLTILCGGGVTSENYTRLAAATGIKEFHGRKLAVLGACG